MSNTNKTVTLLIRLGLMGVATALVAFGFNLEPVHAFAALYGIFLFASVTK